MMAYSVLNFCIQGCTYTVMGDVSQNIHFGFGLNDQGFFDFFGALRTAANHCRSVKTFLPPPGTDFCRLPYHLFPAFLLFHCHCFTVADNGFHRIAGEMSMVQDIGGKI